jgi:phosphopantothenoylcysteine decarboxylase/phosphopantothenate--cysteine ligase
VTLVSANVALRDPAGAKVVRVATAEELRTAMTEAAADADAVVMAAAVADFRPAVRAERKIKKSTDDPPPLTLVRNPDVLAELTANRRRADQVIVGFAAETDDVLANGRVKLATKGCDLLVVNEVGERQAFETPDNAATILGRDGSVTEVPLRSKVSLAHAVWDLVAERLPRR